MRLRQHFVFELLGLVALSPFLSYSQERAPGGPNGSPATLRARAETGDAAAQFLVGYQYEKGDGIPQSYGQAAYYYAMAAQWTRRAADAGYAMAQTDLGFFYEQGKGVPLDYISAYMWYTLGANGGDSRGLDRMKSLSGLMVQKQVREAMARAAAWMPKPGSILAGERQ